MGSSERSSGHCLYNEWMSLQEQELSELLHHHSLNLETNPTNEAEMTLLLDKIIRHFEEYNDRRRYLAPRNVSAFFSPTWCTTLENSMSWIAGCRPSSFFNLIFALCGSDIGSSLTQFLQDENRDFPRLSASQLLSVDNLQRRTIVEEEKITAQMASLQQEITDTTLVWIARKSDARLEFNDDVREAIGKVEQAMVSAMEDADRLRLNTVKELFKILNPVQALEYILAAKKLRLCFQSWGRQRDHEQHGVARD